MLLLKKTNTVDEFVNSKGSYRFNGSKPIISCPKCGTRHCLQTHTIQSDGVVSPSVVCSECDFHDFVSLDLEG